VKVSPVAEFRIETITHDRLRIGGTTVTTVSRSDIENIVSVFREFVQIESSKLIVDRECES